MSTVNQIYDIVNSLNSQANGGGALAVTDTRSFISYGESVFSSDHNVETFFKALWDRIATTILDNRPYMAQLVSGLWREPFEYGAIMQKLHVKLGSVQAQSDSAWIDTDNMPTNPFAVTPMEIEQRMYNKISAFEIPATYPDEQLKTAFLDERKMAAFIDAMMIQQKNALELSIENLGNVARSALIATAIEAGGAKNVKLLTGFKATLADDDPLQSMTADEALFNREFLRYASRAIAMVIDHMKTMSTLHAADGYYRFTPREYLNVAVLSDFDKSVESYLASVTYHKSIVDLPTENKVIVPYWQGAGTSFDYSDTSSIKLTIDDGTELGDKVEVSNVVAVVYDSEAAGITIDESRAKSIYNPHDEVTNLWLKARQMYFVDVTQNAVAFTID